MMALILFFEHNTIFDKEVCRERGDKFKEFFTGDSVIPLTWNTRLSNKKKKDRGKVLKLKERNFFNGTNIMAHKKGS